MGGENLTEDKKNFVYCEKCGRILIERLPNGLWKFAFGKSKDEHGKKKTPPVEMLIHGDIKIKCFRNSCGHWNMLTHVPFPVFELEKVRNQ